LGGRGPRPLFRGSATDHGLWVYYIVPNLQSLIYHWRCEIFRDVIFLSIQQNYLLMGRNYFMYSKDNVLNIKLEESFIGKIIFRASSELPNLYDLYYVCTLFHDNKYCWLTIFTLGLMKLNIPGQKLLEWQVDLCVVKFFLYFVF